MTLPQPIPGAAAAAATTPESSTSANGTDAGRPSTRSRSHTIAYPRQDADGNSHHAPPDSFSWMSPSSTGTTTAFSPASANTGTAGGILGLLGLSPPANTSRLYSRHSPASYASSVTEDQEAVTPPQALSDRDRELSGDPYNSAPTTLNLNADHAHDDDHSHELDDNFDDIFAAKYNLHRVKSNQQRSSVRGGEDSRNALHRSLTMEPSTSSSHSRRASWSSSSDNASHSPSSVFSWLNGQSRSSGTSTSTSTSSGNRDSGFRDTSNPVGLFRRLSLSTKGRIPVANEPAQSAAPQPVAPIQEPTDRGRSPGKAKNGPRRLSPMGERMLRAHYDTFS